MEVTKISAIIEETLTYVRASKNYHSNRVFLFEFTERLEAELENERTNWKVDVRLLRHIFAPGGALHIVAEWNHWSEKFVTFSDEIAFLTDTERENDQGLSSNA